MDTKPEQATATLSPIEALLNEQERLLSKCRDNITSLATRLACVRITQPPSTPIESEKDRASRSPMEEQIIVNNANLAECCRLIEVFSKELQI